MEQNEYQKAAKFWKEKDKRAVKMEECKLRKAILEYIQANDTCALATGTGDFVRCTPIEYRYHDEAFWMFSEGGLKFLALEQNSNVCLAVFDHYAGFGKLKGLQVSGRAMLVEPFSEEYKNAAKIRKLPLESLKKLPHTMYLIKIEPMRFDFLNSDFKLEGCASRQILEL